MRAILLLLLLASCSNNRANIIAYATAECERAGYAQGTPAFDGCVLAKRQMPGTVYTAPLQQK